MTLRIETFPDRDSLMQAAAERLADALRAGISARGHAVAALSGGSTPAPAYERLALIEFDWSKTTFALVDERLVAPGDPASNEGLLRTSLAPALAAGAALAPMYAPGPLADAASRADALYAPLAIDIALMGMGLDGHTASWFAAADGLQDALASSRTVVAVRAHGAAGAAARLTLTRAAVARAGCVVLLITGADKRSRLDQALRTGDAPVAALFDGQGAPPEVLYAD
ncbi:6-phosphogluconolactonase [Terricaulis sp.]|uniref:6-phosphogluconolactonase n=1 Tax=Terricaulis sp. TaxID=2768686 RepID=UPI003784A6C3